LNREINIQFSDKASKKVSFTKTREFFEFINKEIKFWESQRIKIKEKQNTTHPVFNFFDVFGQNISTLKEWSEKIGSWSDEELNSQIKSFGAIASRHFSSTWLWSGHPYTAAFIECQSEHGTNTATAFLNYVTTKNIDHIGNHDYFLGIMFGYEFLNQDSDIVKRRSSEKKSLGHLRNQLEETNKQLFTEVEEFKECFSTWDSSSRENWNEWLIKSADEHSEQQEAYKNELIDYEEAYKIRITQLENLYEEKLRLEKPAKYWKDAARSFGIHGGLWSLALLASVLLGIVYFSGFYTDWLKGQEIAAKLNTVQGIVISGTVLATYAFLVRTLSKLTFSSFHLMRDAQEREQLTYLYLSLINENKIDEISRDIVLQALFSRSETGLLVNESGPTMPGISEVLRAASRAKS